MIIGPLPCQRIAHLSTTGRRPPARGRNAFRPAVEALEPRWTPTVSFLAQQTFAVGTDPEYVAVGDFNGDGKPDLVATNALDKTVSVLLNTAAGAGGAAFAAQQTFAVGTSPFGVVVADFNGDGNPDLAVANAGAKTVSVLLDTTAADSGTVSFAPQQTFAAGILDYYLAVGDFNGDGRPDLAVTNYSDNTASVLLNTTPVGSGVASFAVQQTFAVGTHPFSVAVGDVNGDGRPDLAVVNAGDKTVSVLLNTTPAGAATLSFAAQQTFAVGTNPQAMAVADVNGDGRPDLAVANFGGKTVSVLLNTTPAGATTASFAAQQTFAVGTNPRFVAAGDFDGDGRPDLAVANSNDKTVSVLLNTTAAGASTPSFAAQQTFATGSQPFAVAAADVNGDGRPDLAVANDGDKTVSVLLDTTAPFASAVPVVVGQFGTQGVWEFNRALGTWVQLAQGNASRLAADPQGDVVGAFPGYGVWEYHPATGWAQIGSGDASALAMDPLGDVVGAFPGHGVWEFRPAIGFHQIGSGDASALAMDALGDVVGSFPGAGVWEFRPATGFSQIGSGDASALAMDALGDVVGSFPGHGIWEYRPATGFQQTGTADATALAMDALGDVFGAFAGAGVWEFDPYRGWFQRAASDAKVLAVA